MCLAYPGIVVGVTQNTATVKFPNSLIDCKYYGLSLCTGDRVLVQMGVVEQVLTLPEYINIVKAWKNNGLKSGNKTQE